jgi:aspartate kinase
MKDLQKFYKVFKDNNVELVTVRHYEKSIVEQLKKGKMILLEERIRGTLKMVVKNVPIMERIDG